MKKRKLFGVGSFIVENINSVNSVNENKRVQNNRSNLGRKSASIEKVLVRPLKRNKLFVTLFLLVSYGLLCTDIVRSGTSFALEDFVEYKPFTYNTFGPYAYQLIKIKRRNDTGHEGSSEGTKVKHAKVWSYKYDTTSISFRAVVKLLNITSWPRCLFYEKKCRPDGTLSLSQTFSMIDDFVDAVQHPSVYSPIKHKKTHYNCSYFNVIVVSRFIDMVFEYFGDYFLQRRTASDTEVWYINDQIGSSLNESILCNSRGYRPFLCSRDNSNFNIVAGPDLKYIDNPVLHAEKLVKEKMIEYPNHVVDAALIQSLNYPISYIGGLIEYMVFAFEAVLFTRVRKCDSSSHCKTVEVVDFRYEGDSTVTNAKSYMVITNSLRYIAQSYYYLRLVFLLFGIHFANIRQSNGLYPKTFLEKISHLIHILMQLPSQVVIYGSSLPVILYCIAHCIDAPMTHDLGASSLKTLQGYQVADLKTLFVAASGYMRSVWLMGTVAIFCVKYYTAQKWDRIYGIVGVRGHLFAMISFMSLIMGLRLVALRNSRVIQAFPNVSAKQSIINSTNYRSYGVISDFISIMISTFVYGSLRWAAVLVMRRKSRNGFLAKTYDLPVSAGSMWSTTSLCVTWNYDLFKLGGYNKNFGIHNRISTKENNDGQVSSLGKFTYRSALMNIVILTDPFRYLLMKNSLLIVYKYRSTNGIFFYTMKKHILVRSTLTLESEFNVRDLSWEEIIRIR